MKYILIVLFIAMVGCSTTYKSYKYVDRGGYYEMVVWNKTKDGITKDILTTGDTLVTDYNKYEIYFILKDGKRIPFDLTVIFPSK